jgi:acyl-CoA synthetase (AMP-forming)/AMP-acid ligase II
VRGSRRASWRGPGPDSRLKTLGAGLARFRVPEVVEVLDVLPRDPNGKVMKALLRLSA